ncbi:hypothetical protein B566_EDAN004460 [Ephemera danica]|nr:hypothetical protein B566_EDAN004460 [Ephemera danica]
MVLTAEYVQVLLLLATWGALLVQGAPTGDAFKLIVLHNNDMHARFEQTNAQSGKCSHKLMIQNQCYGGFARVAHVVNDIKKNEKNVIFLNAGDTYQGTVWYTLHKWPVVAKFIQMIGLDAMSLGNHEFDDGVDGLAPFLENITIPVVGANMDLSQEPRLIGHILPSTVLTVDNRKIGVIGYLTPETRVTSIDREAKRLKAQGIDILIAVGHSGFGTDQRIAREVPDIDLVIGGDRPDNEIPAGLYPTLVTQPSGRKVPVVSAYAYTKYMGRIELTIDMRGEVTHHQGNPILLDRTVPQDEGVLIAMKPWGERVAELAQAELGRTRVYLNGSQEACRMRECNMGNLIADAYVQYNAWLHSAFLHEGWTNAALAAINGGGIRNSIDEKANNGKFTIEITKTLQGLERYGTVTMEDLLAVLPFQNSVVIVGLRGVYIKEMLENSVINYDKTGVEAPGKFLHVSGLQVTYDLDKPAGQRVVRVLARCAKCRVPVYTPVEDYDLYELITTTYLAEGNDGYQMIRDHAESKVVLDASESDIVAEYIKRRSPVSIGVENRVTLLGEGLPGSGANSKQTTSLAVLLLLASALLLLSD